MKSENCEGREPELMPATSLRSIKVQKRLVAVIILWITAGWISGTARGNDEQVNTYTTGDQSSPSVARGAAGHFVVVWQSEGSPGTDSTDSIQARRYAPDGSPLGDQFQVNTFTPLVQSVPEVAVDSEGDFVVVWWSWRGDGTDPGRLPRIRKPAPLSLSHPCRRQSRPERGAEPGARAAARKLRFDSPERTALWLIL